MHVALLKTTSVPQKKQPSIEKKPPRTSSKIKKPRGRPKVYRALYDLGTPELQRKRKILFGMEEHPPLAPSQDISQSLRLLYYRKVITQSQREAGCSYKLLWEEVHRFLGNQTLSRSSITFFGQIKSAYNPWQDSTDLPKNKEYLFQQWTHVQNFLAQEDIKIQQAVYRIVIENLITPDMIEEDVSLPPFILHQLRVGLDLLQKYFHPAGKSS